MFNRFILRAGCGLAELKNGKDIIPLFKSRQIEHFHLNRPHHPDNGDSVLQPARMVVAVNPVKRCFAQPQSKS